MEPREGLVRPGSFPLRGAIELHSEAPNLEFLELAREVGLRDVVIKWPGGPDSAPVAQFANARSPGGPRFWGGVVLDRPAGGMNPSAVTVCGSRGGKFVWMPTVDALHHRRINAQSADGAVRLLDDDGNLLPEVCEVLDAARAWDMVIGTGHIGPVEAERLVDAALAHGIRKILSNHPLLLRFSLETIRRMAGRGVFIEHCYVPNHPKPFDVSRIVEAIHEVGLGQSLIADFGVFGRDANVADALAVHGLDAPTLRALTTATPARVLSDE
ncbi:DUF6282 family protein [Cognatazoarcus halotolerans]|uniref:DUF6282 family protein n=1 Tax=Cognatazoarcus halotolerans TaxID=2686016 RepID=UPI00135CF1BB|nr:DUF6282 family protein [Cognatazoarcus halotolerans]MCP5233471.1 hypothetical protein [Zoogloeaceae bacterium]